MFQVQEAADRSALEPKMEAFPFPLSYTCLTMGNYIQISYILAFESPHLDLNWWGVTCLKFGVQNWQCSALLREFL